MKFVVYREIICKKLSLDIYLNYKSITYVIRTEESLQAIYKKLSLDIYLNYKSITYIIRTEESLQAIYKKLSLIVCDYHKLIN